jgi:hypothetical protein
MAARGIEGREEEEEEEKMCNFPKMAVSDTMQEEGGGRVASEGGGRRRREIPAHQFLKTKLLIVRVIRYDYDNFAELDISCVSVVWAWQSAIC